MAAPNRLAAYREETAANRLDHFRWKRDAGLSEVAAELGATPDQLSRWESGEDEMPGPVKEAAAAFYGVSVAYLMRQEGKLSIGACPTCGRAQVVT